MFLRLLYSTSRYARKKKERGEEESTKNPRKVKSLVCKINRCRSCYNCFRGSYCRYWKCPQFFDSFRGAKSIIG
ncbi:hypothetical protein Taro_025596 [Colocasia esculenta]|uniref:Uncharacterized protein n=1 Tax=Colocasia esculenta TaxID=4460 RepID=A0A843V9A8_COLES|nr:hypothetical protein [Colocasia esculenta]